MRILTKFLSTVLATILVASFITGCSAQSQLERRLRTADRSFDAGDYQVAEVEYMNVLQISNLHPHAVSRLGIIFLEQGRVERAYLFLTKASELLPNDLDLSYKVGNINLVFGRAKEAREKALLVLAANPAHPDAPLLLAEASVTPNDIAEARQVLKKITPATGETAPIHLAMGLFHLRERDVKAAEESLQSALKLEPKSPTAYYLLANIYAARNDLKNAQAAFKAASDFSPPRSSRRLGYVDFLLKTGQAEEAKHVLGEMTKESPDYLLAWNKQAEIALTEQKYEDCLASINQVISRDPANIEALLLRGRLYLAQNDAEKALADLERTSTLFKEKSPQVHYYLGLAHFLNNDPKAALKSANQAVTLRTNYTEAILFLAKLHIVRGEASTALPLLIQVVKKQPEVTDAHLLLADAYLSLKKPDEAASVLQQMGTLFPKNFQAAYALGNVLIDQGKFAQARRAFEKAGEIAPNFFPSLEKLVDLDINEKKYNAALERVEDQIKKFPAAAESWVLLAKIHLAQKQTDKAESALLKAIELNPEFRNPYLLLSQVYLSLDQKKQALDKLMKLVTTSTNDVTAYMKIGMIHDSMTNYPAARDAYEKLIAINPKFSPALNNLAYIYSEKLEDLDKAYAMAERSRQQSPVDPYTADTLGWVLYKRSDFSRALGLFLESASRLPDQPEIQFHLGMTHYMLGNLEPARIALKRGVESSINFAGKEEGKKRLEILAVDAKTANAATLEKLEKSLSDNPNDPVILGLVAAIYERTGAVDKAEKSYQTALKQNSRNLAALRGLVRLYTTKLNEPKKAFELAKTANSIAPADSGIAHALGRMYYQAGDYKHALGLLQDASRRVSEDSELLYDLALALYQNGQPDQAIDQMREAVQLGNLSRTEKAKTFLALAGAQTQGEALKVSALAKQELQADANSVPALMASALAQEQSNPDQAKALYEQVIGSNSLFTPAYRNLTLLYAESTANDSKSYEIALKARSAFPTDAALTRAVGIMAYRRADYSRATALLKENVRLNSTDATTYYYLGMAQFQLKDLAGSKTSLAQAVKLNLPTDLAALAKQKLVELK